MSAASWFSWGTGTDTDTELPDIFPLGVLERDFINVDTVNLYGKILTDVIERTQGLTDDIENSLWDNCLQSENSFGLVTMLAKAMAEKKDLFLVYDRSVKLLRNATNAEAEQIKVDYKARGESAVGTYISFKNYTRTDMIKLYSALEYCTINALNKQMNLAKAIQVKMSDLRGSVSLTDSAEVKVQAKAIATSLKCGKDVLLDAKDTIITAVPDLKATEASMAFLNEKRSFYLGLPASYITGQAPKGLGDSGEGDAKAVERGLKNYYFSIIKPVIEAIFGKKTTFKSEDFRQITSSLEAMKIFELTSEELMTTDNKRVIINKLFGLPEDEKGGEPAPDPVAPAAVPGARPDGPPPRGA
jgi:hypothetical protein